MVTTLRNGVSNAVAIALLIIGILGGAEAAFVLGNFPGVSEVTPTTSGVNASTVTVTHTTTTSPVGVTVTTTNFVTSTTRALATTSVVTTTTSVVTTTVTIQTTQNSTLTAAPQVTAVAISCISASPAMCNLSVVNSGTANAQAIACYIKTGGAPTEGVLSGATTYAAGSASVIAICTIAAGVAGGQPGSQAVGFLMLSNFATVPFSGTWS